MDISYNWLKEYVKFNLNPDEVAQILTNIGLEVEHQDMVEEIPGGLEGVVTAKVLECEPHPDSDHLHVTKVDCGTGEILQVVCGAPNVAAGQKVMLATLNTRLVIGGQDVKIKKLLLNYEGGKGVSVYIYLLARIYQEWYFIKCRVGVMILS